ncbi:MAG TPA: nitroreductase family protein [Candidatus Paceibacterota bacterium]|nr:nitroreductase family protein [Candidatus Paceibacterota bacterium]
MKLDDAIEERRSIRKFHTKRPNWKDIIEAVNAGIKGPLAGNIGSVKFVMVDNEEIINEISNACQQSFVGQAQYLLVVCSDTTNVIKSYDERGKIYCHQQAGAAIENVLLKLVDLGLGTCWVGLFDERLVKRAIKATETIIIEAILPIGYPNDNSPKRRKPLLDNSLFFNNYGNKQMKPRKRIEAL